MTAKAFVRARIDRGVKEEAEAVLSRFGLTVSDAVRLTLACIARDKALPVDLKHPNAETRAVMAEARAMMARRRGRSGRATDPGA